MKHWTPLPLLFLLLLAVLGCVASIEASGPVGHHPSPQMELSLFWDDLAPYGDWFWVEPWGWVWAPWDIGPGWRPYIEGHWVWTPLGWTWISDEPWGWGPYHYGRWTYHPRHGWIWVPGRVWAPAWVAWRGGQGWIGWAPLPPDVHWRLGFGLDLGGIDLGITIVEHGWSFCEERHFLDHRVGRRLAPLPRHGYLLRETRDATRYEEIDRRVAVRSFDAGEIEPRVGRVPRYRIEDLERPPRRGEAVDRDAVRIYRPEVTEEPGEAPRHRVAPPPAAAGEPPREPPTAQRQEIERRRAKELSALRAWEKEQQQRLEKEQQRERRQPPVEENRAEVERRQDEEKRVLRREVEREKQVLDNRAERRARAAGEKPAKSEKTEKPESRRKPAKPRPPAAAR